MLRRNSDCGKACQRGFVCRNTVHKTDQVYLTSNGGSLILTVVLDYKVHNFIFRISVLIFITLHNQNKKQFKIKRLVKFKLDI